MNTLLRNFIQRAITGILFVVVLGGAYIWGPQTFAVVTAFIVAVASVEYCRLMKAGGMSPHIFTALSINLSAFLLAFYINFAGLDPRVILAIVALVWCIFLIELFCKNANPLANIALTMLCCVYVGLPFALFNLLVFRDGEYNFWPLIGLFSLVWINDTGAYLCGVTMGKHKLFERISPKKTIEGFVGGVLLTIGVAIAAFFFLDDLFFHAGLVFSIVAGVVVSFVGTAGDLIESMFKRSVKVKDSGSILPGHGGILDRFDAIMFVAPIISLIYYFFIL